MRTELFVKYTKLFLDASRWVNYSGKTKADSLAYHFLKGKNLVLTSAKNKMFDEKISKLPTGSYVYVTISRRKAMVFCDAGKIDHTG